MRVICLTIFGADHHYRRRTKTDTKKRRFTMNWTPNRRQVLQAGAATLAASGWSSRLCAIHPDDPGSRRDQDGDRAVAGLRPVAYRRQEGPACRQWPARRRDRQFQHRCRSQRGACRRPGPVRQHRHAYRDGLRRCRPADQDHRAARRLDDRRRHDHRRLDRVGCRS